MAKAAWHDPNARERLGIAAVLKEQLEKPPHEVTNNYTLVADDAHRTVEAKKATALTITVPPNVFSAGQKLKVLQSGAGQVTFAQGSGVTINSPTTLKTTGQWATVTLEFRSPVLAVLSGNIAAA
jgi:hypothetical protein